MKNFLKLSLYVAFSAIILTSCKKDADLAPAPPQGTITGRIVAANNAHPIKVATVFITSEGKLYLSQTDANGSFTLQAPAGNRHLTIQTGDGSMFRTEMDVVVQENQTTEISAQSVVLNQVATLAYITGTFDEIENILVDTMGYIATPITWAMATSLSNITPFDAIFVNCGSTLPVGTQAVIDSNLAAYVANGGSLYVSDWAVKNLVGDPGSSMDPCNVARSGGFIADSLLCVRKTGVSGSVFNAPIVSVSLQTYLNKTTIDEIEYNLGSWEKINYADATFWETMVTDPTGSPLLIRTNQFTNPTRGTFQVGSSANSGYSLVCVNAGGGQQVTLSVKAADAPALIANGATGGMCDNLNGSGRIYFTTFHNEPNGHIGADIKNILEYVILNL